ncbi:MAG: sigma-70 family RNA polymerase sigma factor [Planctomycetota bacterium]
MPEAASTRVSLLIRLRDNSDDDAWSQFVDIYGPLIFHFARRCQLQESDAADLVQEVMSEVAKSMVRFEYDPEIGQFRSWLFKVAKRTSYRIYQKQLKQPKGTGDTRAIERLLSEPDQHDDLQPIWDQEYQQHLLGWATEQIRYQFQDQTWRAFWLTSVEERTPQEVAELTGLSVGAVYVAKSRVLKKLAEKIRDVDDSFE